MGFPLEQCISILRNTVKLRSYYYHIGGRWGLLMTAGVKNVYISPISTAKTNFLIRDENGMCDTQSSIEREFLTTVGLTLYLA